LNTKGDACPLKNNSIIPAIWEVPNHFSQHAGQVIVADGTPEAAIRLERVLTVDPGLGIARHADAGYSQAVQAAKRHGIKVPMLKEE